MTVEVVVQIVRQSLMAAFWVSAPLLTIAFLGGILVSLVQILTSIQDSAFGAVPRLLLLLLGGLILLPWMTGRMIAYTTAILGDLGKYAH